MGFSENNFLFFFFVGDEYGEGYVGLFVLENGYLLGEIENYIFNGDCLSNFRLSICSIDFLDMV